MFDHDEEREAMYPWPDETNGLSIMGAPDNFTLFTATYVKGMGLTVRGVIIPGSRIQAFYEDMMEHDICGCHPGMGWELVAIDPDPFRIVTTRTLDTHTAMAWLRRPQDVLELENVDQYEACETLAFVPEGEALQTVFNDFTNHVSGGVTMADSMLTDEDINRILGEIGDDS